MKKALIITLILLIVSIVANVLLWKQSQVEERREIFVDTIPYRKPIPVDSFVINYVTEKLPVANTSDERVSTVDTLLATTEPDSKDSVEVTIPITQRSGVYSFAHHQNQALGDRYPIRRRVDTTPRGTLYWNRHILQPFSVLRITNV